MAKESLAKRLEKFGEELAAIGVEPGIPEKAQEVVKEGAPEQRFELVRELVDGTPRERLVILLPDSGKGSSVEERRRQRQAGGEPSGQELGARAALEKLFITLPGEEPGKLSQLVTKVLSFFSKPAKPERELVREEPPPDLIEALKYISLIAQRRLDAEGVADNLEGKPITWLLLTDESAKKKLILTRREMPFPRGPEDQSTVGAITIIISDEDKGAPFCFDIFVDFIPESAVALARNPLIPEGFLDSPTIGSSPLPQLYVAIQKWKSHKPKQRQSQGQPTVILSQTST